MTKSEFSDAYEYGFGKTIRFLLSRGIGKSKAEESAQAAWAIAWEKQDDLCESDQILQWVNTIALNNYRGRFRKEQREDRLTRIKGSAAQANADAHLDLEASALQCSNRDWQLLNEVYVEGYTSVEIAAVLGVKPITIRVRMSRAKQKLRRFLSRSPKCRLPGGRIA